MPITTRQEQFISSASKHPSASREARALGVAALRSKIGHKIVFASFSSGCSTSSGSSRSPSSPHGRRESQQSQLRRPTMVVTDDKKNLYRRKRRTRRRFETPQEPANLTCAVEYSRASRGGTVVMTGRSNLHWMISTSSPTVNPLPPHFSSLCSERRGKDEASSYWLFCRQGSRREGKSQSWN